MAAMSDYLENKLLDHALGTASFTMPTQLYAAAYTAAPSDAGGGTQVTGGSYARVAVDFNAASGGATSAAADIEFPQATADWGTVTHFGLFDASTSGNLLLWGALTASKTIENGDQLIVPAADCDVAFD